MPRTYHPSDVHVCVSIHKSVPTLKKSRVPTALVSRDHSLDDGITVRDAIEDESQIFGDDEEHLGDCHADKHYINFDCITPGAYPESMGFDRYGVWFDCAPRGFCCQYHAAACLRCESRSWKYFHTTRLVKPARHVFCG